MNKVLLFDFDGTIANSFDSFLHIIERLSEQYGFPSLANEDVNKLRLEDPRSLIKKIKIPFYKIPLLARDMKKMQSEMLKDIEPFPHIVEVLKNLKKIGYKLGIVTSNGRENVEYLIKKNDFDIFEYIHTDTSLFGKDKVLQRFLKTNRIAKEDVLYIGDEIRDIQACKKVGIKILAVTWGFNSKAGLLGHSPDYVINTPSELLELVVNMDN